MAFYWKGQYINKFGTYINFDTTGLARISDIETKTCAILGSSIGGKPQEPIRLISPLQAKEVLKGGEGLDAVLFAFNPSANLRGASEIYFVRVDTATQSDGFITNTDGNCIKLTSRDYGEYTNNIEAFVYIDDNDPEKRKVIITLDDTNEVFTGLATVDEIVDSINEKSKLVSAEKVGTDTLPSTQNVVFLNGSTTAPTTADFINGLDKLKTLKVYNIALLTGDNAVIQAGIEHCVYMTFQGQKPRKLWCGSDWGTDIDTYKSNVQLFNSDRCFYFAGGIKRYNSEGVLTNYGSYMLAVGCMGLKAGLLTEEPITYKYLDIEGVENLYKPEEIDEFLNYHINTIEFVEKKGYRITSFYTTYLGSDNTALTEGSVIEIRDVIFEKLKNTIDENFIGTAGRKSGLTLKGLVIDVLDKCFQDGLLLDGYDENGNYLPPYKNITIYNDGTIWYVNFEASPVEPNNYVLINVAFIRNRVVVK